MSNEATPEATPEVTPEIHTTVISPEDQLLNAGPSSTPPAQVDGVTVGRLSVEPEPAPIDPDLLPSTDEVLTAGEATDLTQPANKGARPLHELRELGLVDPDVESHIKEFQRSYTQSKQAEAQMRKELDALKAQYKQMQEERTQILAAVETDRNQVLGSDFINQLPELAAQEVSEQDLYTKEGLEKLAEIKAAKLLQKFTEPMKQQAEAFRKQQEQDAVRQQRLDFIEKNSWVRDDPEIRMRTAELMQGGASLETAAYQASHEINSARNLQKQELQQQKREARREALRATASGSMLHSGKAVEDMTALEEFRYWKEVEANGGTVPAPRR